MTTEFHCDVLVVGSGAAGLTAAVTAACHRQSVLVAEKEPVFGGTTARSGGWVWIPGNHIAREHGIVDDAGKGRTYLMHEAGAHFDAERVDAFLENGPRAIRFLSENTELHFDLGATFADYHPNAPGGMPAGRSLVARPCDGRLLGSEIRRLRPPLREVTLLGMMIGSGKDIPHFFNFARSPVSAYHVVRLLTRHLRDLALYRRPMRLANGNALVGRLAKSCFDKGVPIWTDSPVRQLLVEDSRVVGALVDTPRGTVRVMAAKGIVLAAGGFPQDRARRKALFPHAPTGNEHASPAPPGNTGDGLRLGEAAGGSVDTTLPNAAAWAPISRPVNPDGTLGTFPHFVDRSKPGVIAVTRSGRRFVNEADSYHDFCQAMLKRCREENEADISAFFIADHRAFRKYGLGMAKPWPVPPGRHIRSGYLRTGATLADLAGEIGADRDQLARTVEAFNRHARVGNDPEFGKGTTAYNLSLGDRNHKPNPCLAPIESGPFYAVRVVIGDLGTYAGLRCDGNARVLGPGGKPIPGLYAAGNDALSIMGGNYPGGGTMLGPAVTFGYIAARHIAGVNAD